MTKHAAHRAVALRADIRVGGRVLVRDAFGDVWRATVMPVPRDWRDVTQSDAVTTRGEFVKCWIRRVGNDGEGVPWPVEDVYTSLDQVPAELREKAQRA